MIAWEGKRTITVVSACLRSDGCPDFALNTAEVTFEEYENGIHYYLVEADLLEAGYDEPFVHFDEVEAPPFLHVNVMHHLGIPVRGDPIAHSSREVS